MACSARESALAIGSIIPQGTPAKRASASWHMRASGMPKSGAESASAMAVESETANAALELRPAPIGTSLAKAISSGGIRTPSRAKPASTPVARFAHAASPVARGAL